MLVCCLLRAPGTERRVVARDAEIGTGFGPNVIGLRRVDARAQAGVVGCPRGLSGIGVIGGDQAIDIWSIGISINGLSGSVTGGLREVVILHHYYKHVADARSQTEMSGKIKRNYHTAGNDCRAAQPQSGGASHWMDKSLRVA